MSTVTDTAAGGRIGAPVRRSGRGMLGRGVLGSTLVLLGGLVVATLPQSSVPMGWPLLVAMRDSDVGHLTGLTAVVVGLGLLTTAWLQLCRHVARVGRAADATADARGVALGLVRHATVLWSLPLLIAPPMFSRDGWSYAAQGMMVHLGVSPYEHGPAVLSGPIIEAVDPMWITTLTPYGPLPLIFGDVAASYTGNPWLLVVAHRLVALLGLVLLAWAVPRMARWSGVDPALASALALASPLMMTNGVAGLHNDLLMVGLMAAAVVAAVERGWVYGAVLGGLAAAIKAPAGLVCVGVVLATLPLAAPMLARLRRFASVGAVAVATLLGLGVVSGIGSGWIAGLGVPATVNTVYSITTDVGGILDWIALHVGLGTPPATFLGIVRHVGTAAALVIIAITALRAPTGRPERAVVATATAVGALVLLSPVVHLWYLLWIAPFWCAMRLSSRAFGGLVAVSVLAGLMSPLESSMAGAYKAIFWVSILALTIYAVSMLTERSRLRLRRIEEAHAEESELVAR